ncbi:hypothetical protein NGRA_2675 [Nosema granulosis]|uniref:Uncharacterized protein n=1 Tax=Nosema granulosis TaxID=83296 RepID=A0A9P6GX81_9MICR|nr:hypothetical protein NGRA_2675 [Nosema granulosis]
MFIFNISLFVCLFFQPTLEAYIQSIVLKKTLESISLERRRGLDQDEAGEEEVESAVEKLMDRSRREQEGGPKDAQPKDQGIIPDPEDLTIMGGVSISLEFQKGLDTEASKKI